MVSLQSYVRKGQHALRRCAYDPRVHIAARCLAYGLAGFCLSAASLGGYCQPVAMGLVCACTGWSAAMVAVGGSLGYLVFWGQAGYQALVWMALSVITVLLLSDRRILRTAPLLLPASAGLLVAAAGLGFQMALQDATPIPAYLIRVALGFGSTWLFSRVLLGRNPLLEWLTCGVAVLALAQIVPIPYLGLGYVAGGILVSAGAFPAAALSGLALDMAQITPVPMTAVLACGYLVRFLPHPPKWLPRLAPAGAYLFFMYVCGNWDLYPLPGLLLGGILGGFLPGPNKAAMRRGETGSAQVRLEMASGVLAQAEQILLESPMSPVDEDALVCRAAERACMGCPCRRNCKDSKRIAQLPGLILHKPLLSGEELPILCRKSGRFLAELHRSQEQLRTIHADRQRQQEYRGAVIQQYRFLADFLQDLSDQLSRRGDGVPENYTPDVRIFGNRPEGENGDRAVKFPGVLGKYYVLLCDGMGTGLGAVQEGKAAASILRRLLCAGYPAEYALRSLNSLCALRDRAGVATVDLLELEMDTGKGTLYKWGAAPSYLIGGSGTEKIGTAGPPPGLSATEFRETSYRLSLRRGETLVLVSDGVGEEEALRCCQGGAARSPGELATKLLTCASVEGQDDATVMIVRLTPSASALG